MAWDYLKIDAAEDELYWLLFTIMGQAPKTLEPPYLLKTFLKLPVCNTGFLSKMYRLQAQTKVYIDDPKVKIVSVSLTRHRWGFIISKGMQ